MNYKSLTELIYVRLTAIIWVKNGLISISNLPKDSGDLLDEIYNNIECQKPLIVDCKNVSNLIDHSWDILFKSISKTKRQIVFINYSQLEEKIDRSHKEFCKDVLVEKSSLSMSLSDKKLTYDESVETKIKDYLRKSYEDLITNSFSEHKNKETGKSEMLLLPSTPFYANGEYNANKILSIQNDFISICIYFADYIQSVIEDNKIGNTNKPLRLLSVSLRSTSIAASVSLLLNIPLVTVEYLGPKRNPIDNHGYIRGSGYEILYVGDFSFAGTEIRITKMYASFNNCILNHAFVLGSLLPSDAFTDFKLHSIANLNEINPKAKYSLFKTNE